MKDSQIYIDYNFLPNVNHIYNLIKQEIPFYSFKEHPNIKENMEHNTFWPGKRSVPFNEIEKFLQFFIIETAINKFKLNINDYYDAFCYAHVRFDDDDKTDFVHQDIDQDTLLIYLSPTNTNSGTVFYADDKNTPITEISFIQNTAILFNGSIYHSSKNNFGQNIDNGRMTLNAFFLKK